MIWTRQFWLGAAGTGLLTVDWAAALSVAGAAGLASLLTSIGSADFVAGTPRPTPPTRGASADEILTPEARQ